MRLLRARTSLPPLALLLLRMSKLALEPLGLRSTSASRGHAMTVSLLLLLLLRQPLLLPLLPLLP